LIEQIGKIQTLSNPLLQASEPRITNPIQINFFVMLIEHEIQATLRRSTNTEPSKGKSWYYLYQRKDKENLPENHAIDRHEEDCK